MIVVVSTAANDPEGAAHCARSVAREGVPHRFAAVDPRTFAAATCELAEGSFAVRSEAGQIANIMSLLSYPHLDPNTIVIHLDGDDELTPGAVARVAAEYEDPNVWLTYGSFVRSDGVRDHDWDPSFGRPYRNMHEVCVECDYCGARSKEYGGTATSSQICPNRPGPRQQRWRASHLRTFRLGLFNSIPRSYLGRSPGEFFATCVDRALMLPMIEMAGTRYRVISDVLCRYKYVDRRELAAQEAVDREIIHSLRPLTPLKARPW